MLQFSIFDRVMEAEDHLNNTASLIIKKKNKRQKTCLCFFIFFISGVGTYAQDVITLKNGDDIQAIVQEVEIETVKYKKHENRYGPTYTILKSDIFMIRYQNGEKDVFSTTNEKSQYEETKQFQNTNDQNFILLKSNGTNVYRDVGSDKLSSKDILSSKEVRNILSNNPLALQKYNKAKRLNTWGWVLSLTLTSALVVGASIPTSDDDYGTDLLISAGAGMLCGLIIGTPFLLGANSNMKKAVTLHNSSISNKPARTELKLGITQSGGIGLALFF